MALSWQYIAGFFDGEGNISLPQNGDAMTARVSLCQSRERGKVLLEAIRDYIAPYGIVSGINRHKIYTITQKPLYRLYINGRDSVRRFLECCFPYLHIKKLEAQDNLRYMKIFKKLPSFDPVTAVDKRRMKQCENCGRQFYDEERDARRRGCTEFCTGQIRWKTRRSRGN